MAFPPASPAWRPASPAWRTRSPLGRFRAVIGALLALAPPLAWGLAAAQTIPLELPAPRAPLVPPADLGGGGGPPPPPAPTAGSCGAKPPATGAF